jgi:hypothetical protein
MFIAHVPGSTPLAGPQSDSWAQAVWPGSTTGAILGTPVPRQRCVGASVAWEYRMSNVESCRQAPSPPYPPPPGPHPPPYVPHPKVTSSTRRTDKCLLHPPPPSTPLPTPTPFKVSLPLLPALATLAGAQGHLRLCVPELHWQCLEAPPRPPNPFPHPSPSPPSPPAPMSIRARCPRWRSTTCVLWRAWSQ